MELVYLILIIFSVSPLALAVNESDPNTAYCFQFTFLGRNLPSNVNCSTLSGTPCIAPFVLTTDGTPPNVTYMWENLNQTSISCPLDPGFACIKYSYTYSNAVLNMSYFCGKMVEDRVTSVNSGCYTQKVGAFTVEVCACTSGIGRMPCNSSVKQRHSLKLLIIIILISTFLSCI